MSSSIFGHLSINNKNRPFRIVILGQNGVGKSAFTVRVLTHRFIGDYDPLLENTYTFTTTKCVEGETVSMEIRDTAVQDEHNRLESNIKWADGYVLVYAVTDPCSFNECSRLKVLINSYSKPVKSKGQNGPPCAPIVLVGNMSDRNQDRMISTAEGREKAHEMNSLGFYELSVREERDSSFNVISDLYKRCKRPNRRSELQQRLSAPPSFQIPKFQGGVFENDVSNKRVEQIDSDYQSLPRQRRRRKALYTIS